MALPEDVRPARRCRAGRASFVRFPTTMRERQWPTRIPRSDVSATASVSPGAPPHGSRRGFAPSAGRVRPWGIAACARCAPRSGERLTATAPPGAGPPVSSASGLRRPAPRSANGIGNGPLNGLPRGSARSAAGLLRSRPGACAQLAVTTDDSPSAPDTATPWPWAGRTPAATPRPNAAMPAPGAGNSGTRAARPISAYAAAITPPLRAARAASRAARPCGQPSGRPMPNAGPPGAAAVAGRRRSRALRAAVRARYTRPGAGSGRTLPAGDATRHAAPAGAARPAADGPPSGHRGANRARADRMSVRNMFAGCRSIHRAIPSSTWPPASSTPTATVGRRSRCASPSSGCRSTRWR